ncbi:hypothetical protein [Catellatospora methionotrophica]|uniref:hypothetical protein n=1 Tax=Catellatospora methionotrophica TaxID=121620 RepID=UPI003411D96A
MIELELIARNVLLSSAGPDLPNEVWACRTLVARTAGYRSRLVGALLRLERVTDSPVDRLRLAEEAVAHARLIDPDHDHHATDLLIWALHALQGSLYALGRTTEGRAAREEIAGRYHPGLHTKLGCRVTACYADREPPPVADWAAEAATAS